MESIANVPQGTLDIVLFLMLSLMKFPGCTPRDPIEFVTLSKLASWNFDKESQLDMFQRVLHDCHKQNLIVY